MSPPHRKPHTAPTNVVRPPAWTLARVNAKRLDDLRRRITEAEARSTALTADFVAVIATQADPGKPERQFLDAFDALERLRFEHWMLSQDEPK